MAVQSMDNLPPVMCDQVRHLNIIIYYPPMAREELVPHQATSTDASFQAAIKVM